MSQKQHYVVFFTQLRHGCITVQAESMDEAEEKFEEFMFSRDEDDLEWDQVDAPSVAGIHVMGDVNALEDSDVALLFEGEF